MMPTKDHPFGQYSNTEGHGGTVILAFGRVSGAHLNPAVTFNLYANSSGCCAISAGTQPTSHVHPEAINVMQEVGVDLNSAKPQKLTEELARGASVLVTMGCGEACPFVPGLRTLDWSLPDPKGQSLNAVRAIRDEIHERVKGLLQSECSECAVGLNCR